MGTALLTALERLLAEIGCARVHAVYEADDPMTLPFEVLLRRRDSVRLSTPRRQRQSALVQPEVVL